MKNWHSTALAEAFDYLNSRPGGLKTEEAVFRLEKNGRNILPQEKPYSRVRLFLSQFNSPLMYILLAAVAISFSLGHYSDTTLIVIVLLINTTVGFYQENKANRSLSALKKMVKIQARVWRDGGVKEIDSEELVPGDVMILRPGDKVPADGRLIESKGLKINEASLTGESQAVAKETADRLALAAPLPERTNAVFMGTIVEEGHATALVVATGLSTQIGEVVALLKDTKESRTPLQSKIASLSKITGAFILSLVALLIVVGYFTARPLADIFITSLALAVSAIPEGLLPAITIILVLGMRRILRQQGLVRKLAATETLGSVTVICTDKTGTLTEGKMQVSHILTGTRELMDGAFHGLAKGENANGVESHISVLKIATLANDAFLENPEAELKEWVVRGRTTERALLLAGLHSGLSKRDLEKQYPVLDRMSFESDRKFAVTYHRQSAEKNLLYAVGAPEEIIARCAFLDLDGRKQKLGTAEADKLLAKLDELTKKGLRVLACAHADYPAGTKYQNLLELADHLALAGFVALKDPLRPDTREAIALTKQAGIRTVIVTGDHKFTAQAVAEEIGLDAAEENILEGRELEALSDAALKEKAKYISIYARVSPRHKLRIVDALQTSGEIVAMLGDGVNDAPALKSADIGVAVGSGTDVAKEVSDLVLLDDSFRTIVKAVEQGRVAFGNIRKIFIYLVSDDFSELFMFLASLAAGLPLPLLSAQILWINLVEDGFPSIALTTEQETKDVMKEKPRQPREPILNRPMKQWMAAIFFITGLAAFLTFFFFWRETGDLARTRTIVFALMCADSLLFAFCVRSFKQTIFRRDIFSNRYLVGAVAASAALLLGAIYWPFLQRLLQTQPLAGREWAMILTISLAEILLIELSKKKIFARS